MANELHSLFGYRRWANRRTLESLQNCPAAQAEGVRLLAHLLAADHIWLSRLQGHEPRLAVWPTLSLAECEALADELDAAWAQYLSDLREATLDEVVDYRTSRGDAWQNTVGDILKHVATHGGYHRGQIATAVGRAGGEPALTDYIIYVRSTA